MSAESGWLARDKMFRDRVKDNRKIVKTWPKWMQNIVITAKTINTGKYIKDSHNEQVHFYAGCLGIVLCLKLRVSLALLRS